jgi:hypothetical protein
MSGGSNGSIGATTADGTGATAYALDEAQADNNIVTTNNELIMIAEQMRKRGIPFPQANFPPAIIHEQQNRAPSRGSSPADETSVGLLS